MENYIMINGVKLELTPEQVSALTAAAENKRDDPLERMPGDEYYFIYEDGDACIRCDCGTNDPAASDLFDVANYCRNKELMEQRALYETLNRLLWRYSELHGGDPEWDGENGHYSIMYCPRTRRFDIGSACNAKSFETHFCSEEVAESAIKEIVEPFMADHTEFVW